jgi:hypothetical protein
MHITMRHLQWFLVWSVAFYVTALGYVFEARGQVPAAVASLLIVVGCLSWCVRAALEPDSPTER